MKQTRGAAGHVLLLEKPRLVHFYVNAATATTQCAYFLQGSNKRNGGRTVLRRWLSPVQESAWFQTATGRRGHGLDQVLILLEPIPFRTPDALL